MKKIKEYIVLVKELMTLIKELKKVMILAIICGSIGHIIATLLPTFGAYALFKYKSIGLFNFIFIMILFSILRSVLKYVEQLCNHFVAFRVLEIIRDKVFKKLRSLGIAYINKKDTGNLISLITSDIELLEVFYAHTISPVLIFIIHTTFYVIILSKIHIIFGLCLLVFHLIMALFIPYLVSKRGSDIGKENREDISHLNSYLIDTFRGIEESLLYFNSKNRRKEMLYLTDRLNVSSKKLSKINGENNAISSIVIMFANIVMLLISSYLYRNNILDAFHLIVVNVCFISSFGPVSALSNLSNNLLVTFASGERIISLLNEKPLVNKVIKGKEVSSSSLKVSNVSFSYNDKKVLDDISFNVNKGEILGIKGKSGYGKSTLLKLIMRFYDVDSGSIKIGDIDLKDINTKSIIKNGVYISQYTYLFKGTILDNLKIGKKDATMDEIIFATKKASIHDFIMELKDNYNTKILDVENSLSTGEKQRLSLARAFLKNPKILLLDEPTSNIDALNESVILKSIYESKDDKAIILVSHKKSTLRIADTIISFS